MPAASYPRTKPKPQGRMVFVWLTLIVALVHLALLSGPADLLGAFQSPAQQTTNSFSTRTIAPEPPATVQPLAPPVSAKPARPKPATTKVTPPLEPPQAAPTPPESTDANPPEPANAALPPESASGNTSGNANAQTATPPTAAASDVAGAAANDATKSAAAAPSEPPRKLTLPPSVRLLYDVKGVVTYAYTGGSELLWLNQGSGYSARLQITKFGFNLRTWNSKGDLSGQGLEPLRFGDRTRSEVAAHFQRDKGIVSFSANTPDVPLLPGAQDYLSSFFQLAGMLAGEPQRYPPGSLIAFQVVNARSAEPWVFRVDGPETIELPDGPKAGVKLTREHDVQYDTKVELWLAPDLSYVPVRIRLSQGNGDFAELLWRSAQKPE